MPAATVEDAIAGFAPALPLAVGLSGGADSTALLVACAARWPGAVEAIHVHHGLQAAADGFAQHCGQLCAALGVPLAVCRTDARPAPGASPEDAARRARYASFSAAARTQTARPAIKTIALAHNADDQVETVLLALSRGGGVAGLAGMPAVWQRDGIAYARPLLGVPAAAIRAWLQARGIAWVDDPTNTAARYTRNRIRNQVLPALDAALPQFRATCARSARHAADAALLLAELAAADLAAAGDPPSLAALQALSRPRQANLLRHWLRQAHATTPTEAQLQALQVQIAACRTRGHRIDIVCGRGRVRREGACLRYEGPMATP